MLAMQKKPPPIIDAEFEVIYPPPGDPPPSWIERQFMRVPMVFWIVAAMALAGVAKGGRP
jgi:hypothetical protein